MLEPPVAHAQPWWHITSDLFYSAMSVGLVGVRIDVHWRHVDQTCLARCCGDTVSFDTGCSLFLRPWFHSILLCLFVFFFAMYGLGLGPCAVFFLEALSASFCLFAHFLPRYHLDARVTPCKCCSDVIFMRADRCQDIGGISKVRHHAT